MPLKCLEGLLNQIANVFTFLLRVINPIATVQIHILENVQNWQDLTVIRDQCLTHHIARDDQVL